MNKTDLVDAIAKATEMSKQNAGKVLEVTLDAITEALKDGDQVQLVGFGTFKVKTRSARKGVNPSTRQKIDIPAANVPAFIAGKNLKEAVK